MANEKDDRSVWVFRLRNDPVGVRPIEDEVRDALQRQDKSLMANREEEEHVSAVPIYGAPLYVMPAPTLSDDPYDYEFDVRLEDYSQTTLAKVVQVVRRVLPMDLAKAVALVKSAPVVLASKVSLGDASEIESEFIKVGAQVRVVNSYTKEVVRV